VAKPQNRIPLCGRQLRHVFHGSLIEVSSSSRRGVACKWLSGFVSGSDTSRPLFCYRLPARDRRRESVRIQQPYEDPICAADRLFQARRRILWRAGGVDGHSAPCRGDVRSTLELAVPANTAGFKQAGSCGRRAEVDIRPKRGSRPALTARRGLAKLQLILTMRLQLFPKESSTATLI